MQAWAQQSPTRYALVFIGNSITYGATLRSPQKEAPPVQMVKILERKGYPIRYANCGHSGSTTADFLPASNRLFPKVMQAADSLYDAGVELLFSIMLGTNDSAAEGPAGAPVAPEQYKRNLQLIIDSLHQRYPRSHFMLHQPIWYSPNTQNRSVYLEEGLKRLQTYTPQLELLIKENPEFVLKGDRKVFAFFKKNPEKYFTPEKNPSGIFYLHPNALGAQKLGAFWADCFEKYFHP
ncbi:hypothetical protein A8C56_20490 [Niabella ginsenosidivorans]|uniref:SGNH hydrolase-type esterase domain-containing protein n=2 Tax=Niabella ginsenosidivorans TaxID=1176587 RepID=A0A1A9I8U1_9BACT|nr:hypothetical protein A8C56_20490 [Niabella ginsenosidivorans]